MRPTCNTNAAIQKRLQSKTKLFFAETFGMKNVDWPTIMFFSEKNRQVEIVVNSVVDLFCSFQF
jgi:hypothetical protein